MLTGLLIAASLALGTPPIQDDPAPTTATLKGQVVLLRDELQSRGIGVDRELLGDQIALKAEDGGLTPLLPNPATVALVRDDRLRDRPSEVVGRFAPGVPYLEVVSFRVEEQGTLRTPEYYCEVCTISTRSPGACPCCQDPLELRYEPAP